MSKETYFYVQRDLLTCQKRPTYIFKETYVYAKRDLLMCQKRPAYVSKETYLYVKKRPTDMSNIACVCRLKVSVQFSPLLSRENIYTCVCVCVYVYVCVYIKRCGH